MTDLTRLAMRLIRAASAPCLAIVLGATMLTDAALAITRSCDAIYRWETTGGSVKGSFGKFSASGSCGSTVPNRCRKRAREAAVRCMGTQWETRWQRKVPELCLNASHVNNYDLRLKCIVVSGEHKCRFFLSDNNIPHTIETIVGRGDIKARLEAEVCCRLDNGNHAFPNVHNVHVRLRGQTSGQNSNCSSSTTYTNDYKIDCAKVRDTICRP